MSRIYWSWKHLPNSLHRLWQNLTRGWNYSDCWNLDYVVAAFVLPRLKLFRENLCGCPGGLTMEQWQSILDDMIVAFEEVVNESDAPNCPVEIVQKSLFGPSKLSAAERETHDNWYKEYSQYMLQRHENIERGLALFAKYYQNLWD